MYMYCRLWSSQPSHMVFVQVWTVNAQNMTLFRALLGLLGLVIHIGLKKISFDSSSLTVETELSVHIIAYAGAFDQFKL